MYDLSISADHRPPTGIAVYTPAGTEINGFGFNYVRDTPLIASLGLNESWSFTSRPVFFKIPLLIERTTLMF